jgi:hypothetical protein
VTYYLTRDKRRMSQRRFNERITEILAAYARMKLRRMGGWAYVRKWRKPTRVEAHTRDGHYAWILIKKWGAK